jgi:hypothetical protein
MKHLCAGLIVLIACISAHAQPLRERLTRAAVVADFKDELFDAGGNSRGELLRVDSLIGYVICDSTPIAVLRDWQGETLFRRNFTWIPCPVGAAEDHVRSIPPRVVFSDDGGTIAVRDGEQWFVCHSKSPREFTLDNPDKLLISPKGSFFICVGDRLRVYDFAGRETKIRESCGPCEPRFAGDSLLICANETDSCVIDLSTGMMSTGGADNVSPWRTNSPEIEAIISSEDSRYVDLYARNGDLLGSYENQRAVTRTAMCPASSLLAINSFGDGQWEQVILALKVSALDEPIGTVFSRGESSDGGEYVGLSIAGGLVSLRGIRIAVADEGEQFLHPNASERYKRLVPFSQVLSVDTINWRVADTATVSGWYIGGSGCASRMLEVDSLGGMYVVDPNAEAPPRRRGY